MTVEIQEGMNYEEEEKVSRNIFVIPILFVLTKKQYEDYKNMVNIIFRLLVNKKPRVSALEEQRDAWSVILQQTIFES